MTILDSNVLSELMRPSPWPEVEAWVASQPMMSLFITTVTQAEILYGILLLPAGRRREDLSAAVDGLFGVDFAGRILPFDCDAAKAFADISAARRSLGRPISQFDAQIAAITRSRDAALATRNTSDFEGCGIRLINPWTTATTV